ncbi:MAG TPA: hypothetical protein VGM39_03705 [Kofleriaceae bacterium]|jgi:hypothetical protein
MSYSTEQAALLANQLERLATSNAYQLVGHHANLAFWLEEVVHALAVIDDYSRRFGLLRDAHTAWTEANHTTRDFYCAHCGGACELGPRKPPAPTRVSSEEMNAAKKSLRQGAYRLLLRCYRASLLDEGALRGACDRIGVSLEREDLD